MKYCYYCKKLLFNKKYEYKNHLVCENCFTYVPILEEALKKLCTPKNAEGS